MSGQDELRERIARALWERQQVVTSRKYPGFIVWRWDEIDEDQRANFLDYAPAVIAALGLTEDWDEDYRWDGGTIPIRRWTTPWERIEGDG